MPSEEYVEAVLTVVEAIPAGRVSTYGLVAEAVGSGGPRQVGAVMALHGGGAPWWRVVRADGSLPPSHQAEAGPRYLEEGTPRRPSGRIDMDRAVWLPPLDAESPNSDLSWPSMRWGQIGPEGATASEPRCAGE